MLSEYHSRLVTDMVTGKLDVREAASKLHSVPMEPVANPDEMPDASGDLDDTEAEDL